MSKFVLKDCSITVNNTDLSDHFSSVTIEDTADEVEVTGFTTSGYREYLAGLKTATVTATAFQDFAGTSVNAILYPLYTSGGTFDVVVKPTSGTVSPTNPKFTMRSSLYSLSPLDGGVGDASTTDITFRLAGTAGVVMGTA